MKRLLVAGIAAGMMSSSAMAAPLVWTLSGVTFDDGESASGSFTYDADTGAYSNYAITTGGPFIFTDFTYNTDNASVSEGSDANGLTLDAGLVPLLRAGNARSLFDIFDPIGSTLALRFARSLTNAGGTIGLSGYEKLPFITLALDNGDPSDLPIGSRGIVSGSVVAQGVAAVPEPAAWAMMIGGFGMVAGAMRYRRGRRNVAFA